MLLLFWLLPGFKWALVTLEAAGQGLRSSQLANQGREGSWQLWCPELEHLTPCCSQLLPQGIPSSCALQTLCCCRENATLCPHRWSEAARWECLHSLQHFHPHCHVQVSPSVPACHESNGKHTSFYKIYQICFISQRN